MIFEGSRYENASLLRVPMGDGTYRLAAFERNPYPSEFDFIIHISSFGDRGDRLAHKYYGDASLWWVIAQANPEITYFDDLEKGRPIRIPSG